MNKTVRLILIYTILFGILTAGIFLLFILGHKSFIQYGDGYRQGYFWLAEHRNILDAFLSGDGITRWSWSKGLGMDTGFITDPFSALAACFKPGYLELGYTVALVLQLYFCGLAFIAFAKEVGMTDLQCILGALSYAFCGWGIDAALVQYSFVLKFMLFPILVLSVDRIYKGKSPIIFILTVAYYTLTGIYFAYMAAIGVILYILFRYPYYHDGFKAGDFFASLGKFIIYGVTGLIISAVTAVASLTSLMGSATDSGADGYGLLYDSNYYLNFGRYLISQAVTNGFGSSYTFFGLSAIVLMAVPLAFRKFSLKSTPAIMVILCGIMFIFPFFSSALNGFGYCSTRWFFMAAFFLIWAGLDGFRPEEMARTKNALIMLAALAVMFIWTIGFDQAGLIQTETDENLFMLLNIFSGLLVLFVVFISYQKNGNRWKSVCIVGICAITMVACWNVAFKGNIDSFLRNNEINKQLKASTQRVSNQIDDRDFYRTDQVNGIRNNRLLAKPANENLWWESKTLYVYDSSLPADMLKFNGLIGNNYGYTERVYMLSNDNRMGLDLLMGVKYFLGNDTVEQHLTPDHFAGYGFARSGVIDGVTIWKNKYAGGLGFGYDACISESEFSNLTRLEREQALLQAAVIPDDEIGNLGSCKVLTAKDIRTDISRPKFRIETSDQIELSDGMITVKEDNAEFTIIPEKVPKGQLVLSFDGFERLYGDGTGGDTLKIVVSDGLIEKSNVKDNNNQTLNGVDHYDINLGYHEEYDRAITVKLTKAGQYAYDDIYLSSMSVANYDKYASERMKSRFDISSYDDRQVAGTVTMQEDGILFFSMYDHDNWDVYVDGKKTELLDKVNIAFTGVELSRGQHEIVLKYSFRMMQIGAIISLFGILLAVFICLVHRHFRKKQTKA